MAAAAAQGAEMTPHQIRAAIRERDGQKCTECGMTADEHRKRFGRTLDVHRIQPGGEYSFANCVTLCRPCHRPKPKSPYGIVPRDPRWRIITLILPPGMKARIKSHARRRGLGAASRYIRNAIAEQLREDEAVF
jgi:hypothetical protein